MMIPDGDTNKKEAELTNLLTQETRFHVIQNILAHPKSLPTLLELEHVINKSQTTILGHIETLQDEGIVEKHKLEDAPPDEPSTFFALTPYGLSVVDQLGVFDDLGLLREMYAQLDKPHKVQKYENAPRPELASVDEVQADLETKLDDLEPNEEIDPALGRKLTGVSYAQQQTAESATRSSSEEFGKRLLKELTQEETKIELLDGLKEIASVAPAVVEPILPTLIQRLNQAQAECQTRIVQVLAILAEAEQDIFDSTVREQISEIEIPPIIDDLSVNEAKQLIFGLEELYTELEATKARAEAVEELAHYALKEEEHKIAANAFDRAATLYEELDLPLERASALEWLLASNYQGKFDIDPDKIKEAGEIYSQNEKFDAAARVYGLGALCSALQGNSDTASDIIIQFDPFEDKITDAESLGVTHAAKGFVAAREANIEQAVEEFNEIPDEFDENTPLMAAVKYTSAKEALENSRSDLAVYLSNQALDTYETLDNMEKTALTHQQLANALNAQQDYDHSKSHYEDAIELYGEIGDTIGVADCLYQLAGINITTHNYESAETHLNRALELLEGESAQDQLDVLLMLGDLYSIVENDTALSETISEAEEILATNEVDQSEYFGKITSLKAELYALQNKSQEAIAQFEAAIEHYEEESDDEKVAMKSLQLATELEDIEQYDQAKDILEQVMKLSEGETLHAFFAAALHKARLHTGLDEYDPALEIYETLLESDWENLDNTQTEGIVSLEKGRILRQKEEFEEAQAALTKALSTLRDSDADGLVIETLRGLVEIGQETDNAEQVISWCESAESYIETTGDSLDEEIELYFKQTRAELQPARVGTPDLLYVGLRYLKADQVEEALNPLREAWNSHSELDEDSEAFTASLSAGVGFVAATRLVTFDEAVTAGESVLDELESYNTAFSEAAEYLYQYLSEATDTKSNLELLAAETSTDDDTGWKQLEAIVFRDLMEQLTKDDDDFETNPTKPLKSQLEDPRAKGVNNSVVAKAVGGKTTPVKTSGNRRAA